MTDSNIGLLTDVILITCIVNKGKGEDVVKAARGAGAQGATIHYARGTGVRERLGILGLTIEAEKEVISVIVANDQLDHIFIPFFSTREEGTGVGLSFAQHIMRLHQGRIHVISDPGKGSEFQLAFRKG